MLLPNIRRTAELRRVRRNLQPAAPQEAPPRRLDDPAAAAVCRCPSHRATLEVAQLEQLYRLPAAAGDTRTATPEPMVWQQPSEDPMAAYSRRRLAAHEEQIAYRSGAYIAGPDSNLHGFSPDIAEARVLRIAANYLSDGDAAGVRLASLVLAGFTGVPMAAVR